MKVRDISWVVRGQVDHIHPSNAVKSSYHLSLIRLVNLLPSVKKSIRATFWDPLYSKSHNLVLQSGSVLIEEIITILAVVRVIASLTNVIISYHVFSKGVVVSYFSNYCLYVFLFDHKSFSVFGRPTVILSKDAIPYAIPYLLIAFSQNFSCDIDGKICSTIPMVTKTRISKILPLTHASSVLVTRYLRQRLNTFDLVLGLLIAFNATWLSMICSDTGLVYRSH